MNSPLAFEEYLKKKIVKKQTPNKLRAENVVKEANRKENSLKRVIDKIGIDNENANDIIESCYDILINLIRSKMLLKGYGSSGRGAHEAEVSYLRKMGFPETDVRIANQLRYFRNGISYYGKKFDKEYAQRILSFLNKIKKRLK